MLAENVCSLTSFNKQMSLFLVSHFCFLKGRHETKMIYRAQKSAAADQNNAISFQLKETAETGYTEQLCGDKNPIWMNISSIMFSFFTVTEVLIQSSVLTEIRASAGVVLDCFWCSALLTFHCNTIQHSTTVNITEWTHFWQWHKTWTALTSWSIHSCKSSSIDYSTRLHRCI